MEGMVDRNMKNQKDLDEAETEGGSIERDILIEGAIMQLGRNLLLEKLSGIHWDSTS